MSRFFQVAASRPALVGNGRHRSNRHMKSSQPRRQAPYETPCKQRVRSSSAFTPSGLPSIELPGPAYLGFGQRGPLPTSSQPPPLTPTPHTKRNQRDLSSSKTQYTWSLSPATAERASKPDRAGKDQFQLRPRRKNHVSAIQTSDALASDPNNGHQRLGQTSLSSHDKQDEILALLRELQAERGLHHDLDKGDPGEAVSMASEQRPAPDGLPELDETNNNKVQDPHDGPGSNPNKVAQNGPAAIDEPSDKAQAERQHSDGRPTPEEHIADKVDQVSLPMIVSKESCKSTVMDNAPMPRPSPRKPATSVPSPLNEKAPLDPRPVYQEIFGAALEPDQNSHPSYVKVLPRYCEAPFKWPQHRSSTPAARRGFRYPSVLPAIYEQQLPFEVRSLSASCGMSTEAVARNSPGYDTRPPLHAHGTPLSMTNHLSPGFTTRSIHGGRALSTMRPFSSASTARSITDMRRGYVTSPHSTSLHNIGRAHPHQFFNHELTRFEPANDDTLYHRRKGPDAFFEDAWAPQDEIPDLPSQHVAVLESAAARNDIDYAIYQGLLETDNAQRLFREQPIRAEYEQPSMPTSTTSISDDGGIPGFWRPNLLY